MSDFHPLQTLAERLDSLRACDPPTISAWMRQRAILDTVSKRAPTIVVVTLCLALLGSWTSAPIWLANCLALVVGSLTLILLAARGRRRSLSTSPKELGFSGLKERLAYELAGK